MQTPWPAPYTMGDDFEGIPTQTTDDATMEKHGTSMFEDGQDTNEKPCDDEISQIGNDDCIPECDDSIKPYLEQRFPTIDEGVQFYKRYAAMVGFNVQCSTMRRNRDGDIGVKYLLCSREGHKLQTNEVSKPRSDSHLIPGTKLRTKKRTFKMLPSTQRTCIFHVPFLHWVWDFAELVNVVIMGKRNVQCECGNIYSFFPRSISEYNYFVCHFLGRCVHANIMLFAIVYKHERIPLCTPRVQ